MYSNKTPQSFLDLDKFLIIMNVTHLHMLVITPFLILEHKYSQSLTNIVLQIIDVQGIHTVLQLCYHTKAY